VRFTEKIPELTFLNGIREKTNKLMVGVDKSTPTSWMGLRGKNKKKRRREGKERVKRHLILVGGVGIITLSSGVGLRSKREPIRGGG